MNAQLRASVFQFPSNGKAYPKESLPAHLESHHEDIVSIPFKRESVSKEEDKDESFSRGNNVSIPFKRESVSKVRALELALSLTEVSIPFKRESVSKEPAF